MTNYKPFLIQKLKPSSLVKDSKDFNIWVKSVPFRLFPNMKELPSRSWIDQNGDDEYIPDNPIYEAYNISCQFVYIGKYELANTQIRAFLQYLAEDGMFSFYDTYTKIGRTNVRYVSTDDNPDVFYRKEGSNDIVQFTVTLKINDPITNITLTK